MRDDETHRLGSRRARRDDVGGRRARTSQVAVPPGIVKYHLGRGERVYRRRYAMEYGSALVESGGHDGRVVDAPWHSAHEGGAQVHARYGAHGESQDEVEREEGAPHEEKGIDFVPLKKERYDLVFKQSAFETPGIKAMLGILESGLLREEFASLGGYDTSDMGRIMWMG